MNSFYSKIKNLPIVEKLDELALKIGKSCVSILNSAPGSGKSTVVPIFLLDKLLKNQGKIIMLEPRKLAAKMAACRMAELLGEKVGERVGYIFKGEKCVSAKTQIEVVTEGIFTKIIQNDPFLEGYKIIIFDEFHERNINSDLGLAFSLDVQKNLRDDLKILLMSGSLNSDKLTHDLNAELIVSDERRYDLEINYLKSSMKQIDLIQEVVKKILDICTNKENNGDILVFLSGAGEINKIADILDKFIDNTQVIIHKLYSAMDKKSQDAAIMLDEHGRRKIILSSNISESSLTIENIHYVIDSGWEKRLIYDPSSSLNRLTRLPISQSSAIQRANRAGRLGKGVVYRLYREDDYSNFPASITPELEELELSNFLLELSVWGSSFEQLFFLTEKNLDVKLSQARDFLILNGIIDEKNNVTPFGRRVYSNSIELRYGIMIEKSKVLDLQVLACEIAALLEDGAIYSKFEQDIEVILENMRRKPIGDYSKNLKQLLKNNHLEYKENSLEKTGLLLAFAFPEFIAKKRKGNDNLYLLANGVGGKLKEPVDHVLSKSEFLCAAKLDRSNQANGVIYLAASLEEVDLKRYFEDFFREEDILEYSEEENRFLGVKKTYFQNILLQEKPLAEVDEELLKNKIGELLDNDCLKYFELTPKVNALWKRIQFARKNDSELFPDFELKKLTQKIKEYVFSSNLNLMNLKSLKKLDFFVILGYSIRMTDRELLDRLYPEYYLTPCGSRILLDYTADEIVLRVKTTEMYGVKNHPVVGMKKIPLRIELLSPADRVIQITCDLPDFWQNNYRYVQKEMKSRYIKHFWPDNPLEAVPTKKIKNKM